jgi:hypothetical protein
MNEAQKFFRYLTPGMVLIIEIGIYLSILNWDEAKLIFKSMSTEPWSLAGIFLATGGVGYFLSFIYHTISDGTPFFNPIKINYTRMVADALLRNWLRLHWRNSGVNITGDDLRDRLTIDGAHMIKSGILYERKPSSARIEDISKRMDSFYNFLHGSGATLIGSVIAIPVWVSLYCCRSFYVNPWLAIPVGLMNLVIIVFHVVNYDRIARKTQSLVEIALSNELNEVSLNGNHPFSLDVSRNDINFRRRRLSVRLRWLRRTVRRMI